MGNFTLTSKSRSWSVGAVTFRTETQALLTGDLVGRNSGKLIFHPLPPPTHYILPVPPIDQNHWEAKGKGARWMLLPKSTSGLSSGEKG
jgi:hypothetical protein